MPDNTFDPDRYLQATDPGPGFNPNEYLSETNQMPGVNIGPQVIKGSQSFVEPVAKVGGNIVGGTVKDMYNLGRVATQVTPEGLKDLVGQTISHPIDTGKKLIDAYLEGHPNWQNIKNASVASGVRSGMNAMPGVVRNVTAGLMSPESMFAAPYQMAAYEQEKIRANPVAPEYANNPYAQMYRGEFPTQGAAGAYNRREAIANQRYGGLTPQEQNILEQDALDRQMRLKAAEKVLGPVKPQGM